MRIGKKNKRTIVIQPRNPELIRCFAMTYNPSVVDIEDAGESDFNSFIYNVPSKGCLRMVAYQTGAEGLKGDVKFAEIQVKAVGKANESSELKLEVKELKDNEGFLFILKLKMLKRGFEKAVELLDKGNGIFVWAPRLRYWLKDPDYMFWRGTVR